MTERERDQIISSEASRAWIEATVGQARFDAALLRGEWLRVPAPPLGFGAPPPPYVCPACHQSRCTRAEYHDCCIEPRYQFGPHNPCGDVACGLCSGRQE